jgi:hypothetical protein
VTGRFLGVAAALFGWALGGCSEQFPCVDCGPLPGPHQYHVPTAPESVLVNLQVSYRRREIEPYARLLSPEYVFNGLPSDVQDLGLGPFPVTAMEDSIATALLFRTSLVSSIRIALTHGPAEPVADLSFPPGTMPLHVDRTDLEVDQADGIIWLVTNPQDFYFRRGLATAGEDTTHWFLSAWTEVDTTSGGSPPESTASPVRPISWGALQEVYR